MVCGSLIAWYRCFWVFLQTIGLKTYHETYDKDLSVGSIMLYDKMSGMSCKSVVMFLEWLLQPIAWPVKAHSLFLSGINGFLKAIQTDYSNICVTWTHFITDLFFFFSTHTHISVWLHSNTVTKHLQRVYKSMHTAQYRRSLYAEYAVCVGHQLPGGSPSQLLKCAFLKKKTWCALISARSHRLNADDHNWWTTMPMKRHQQSGAEKREKKKMKTKPSRHFQVGYIHSRGGARGGGGGGVATTDLSLATPLATPLKTAVLFHFFSWQEIHLLRRGTGVSLYDHIKQETRTSASPQRQAQVKRAWKGTGTKWASVEQQWTAVWWDAVRLYISKTNFPVLSAVTVLTAHTFQLYANIRRTLYIFIINNVHKKLWAYKVMSSVKSWNYQKRQFVHSCMYSITLKNVSQMLAY